MLGDAYHEPSAQPVGAERLTLLVHFTLLLITGVVILTELLVKVGQLAKSSTCIWATDLSVFPTVPSARTFKYAAVIVAPTGIWDCQRRKTSRALLE